jgi:hypothetical protein
VLFGMFNYRLMKMLLESQGSCPLGQRHCRGMLCGWAGGVQHFLGLGDYDCRKPHRGGNSRQFGGGEGVLWQTKCVPYTVSANNS